MKTSTAQEAFLPEYFTTDTENWDVRVANGQFLGYLEASEEMLEMLTKLQSKSVEEFRTEISLIVSERTKFIEYAYENLP